MILERHILRIDDEMIACEYLLRKENVVILHGAGKSGRNRYYGFADFILKLGFGVVLFDYSGHGQSSGEMGDSSLARRKIQAIKVIDELLLEESTFYVIGFSMGAQTVCDIIAHYGARIPAILLGCPAIYDRKAADIVFENPDFTRIIRERNSWLNSTAQDRLKKFKGKSIIVIGDDDKVIPHGVIEQIKGSAMNPILHRYEGVDHQLAKWLSGQPEELEHVIKELLD